MATKNLHLGKSENVSLFLPSRDCYTKTMTQTFKFPRDLPIMSSNLRFYKTDKLLLKLTWNFDTSSTTLNEYYFPMVIKGKSLRYNNSSLPINIAPRMQNSS